MMKLTERIDFGFVLLADPLQEKALEILCNTILEKMPCYDCEEEQSVRVRKLHLSVGHYAILRAEVEELKTITQEIAKQFSALDVPMKENISISKHHITLECLGLHEHTNPKIVEMYKRLRSLYLQRIITKQPTTQAYYQKFLHKDNNSELALIETCYQNWGTPEDNRIRPHFTLVYNYAGEKNKVEEALKDIATPHNLRSLRLTRLGVAALDLFGNPLQDGLFYEVPLIKEVLHGN
ncbi:MAG: hypothetical protein K2W94_04365 [Alphaproteobacteria bacterium]|nr:hypothetical protein [Alphaproteobacteria bacterium]